MGSCEVRFCLVVAAALGTVMTGAGGCGGSAQTTNNPPESPRLHCGNVQESESPIAETGTDVFYVTCDGELRGYGLGRSIGDASDPRSAEASGRIVVPDRVEAVVATATEACVRTSTDEVLCWGQANHNIDTDRDRLCNWHGGVPAYVLSDAESIASSVGGFCALTHDGTVACWGASVLDTFLFDGPSSQRPYTCDARRVVTPTSGEGHPVISRSGSLCTAHAPTGAGCWSTGGNGWPSVPGVVRPEGLRGALSYELVSAVGDFVCASGTWGSSNLVRCCRVDCDVCYEVAGVESVRQIAVHDGYLTAIASRGLVRLPGAHAPDYYAELPVESIFASAWDRIVGATESCIITASGMVACAMSDGRARRIHP